MKKLILMICSLLLATAGVAQALTVTNRGAYLNEFGPSGGAFSEVEFSGLGSFQRTYTGAGSYNILSLIDNELDSDYTGYDPEFGGAAGTAASGFYARIDDPYALVEGFLNGDTETSFSTSPADVAVVMGWQFTLLAGQQAVLNFSVTDTMNAGGHYLFHYDAVYLEPDFELATFPFESIFYTSSLEIGDIVNPPIPEPSTFVLFGTALVVTGIYARRRRNG